MLLLLLLCLALLLAVLCWQQKNDRFTGWVGNVAELGKAQSNMQPIIDSEAGDIATQTRQAPEIDEVEVNCLCQNLKCSFELDPQSPAVERTVQAEL